MRVLILGGTAEAVELAEALVERREAQVISSLAGRTRAPRLPPGEIRVGGFGGADGLRRFLLEQRIDRVVDATHPFALRMQDAAERACRDSAVPRLRLLRPPWARQPGDRWHEVDGMADAARLLPRLGRRAFLSVGRSDLEAFASCRGVFFLIRGIDPLDELPLRDAAWISGRGPFRLRGELALLREHRIEVLVTKASGGEATYPKIVAARELALPVIMQRRPSPPSGHVVPTVRECLHWLGLPEATPTSAACAAGDDGRASTTGCR